MIATKYGFDTNPLHVAERINADGPGTSSWCLFPWTGITEVSPFDSLTAETTNVSGNSYIRGALHKGRPVLVYLQNGNLRHAVVVYGFEQYDTGGYYHFIFNPEKYSYKDTIEDYYNAGW